MLIFVQFTIADLRSLSNSRGMLLSKPSWPLPTPRKEFVRGAGPIVQRRGRGVNSWVGENFICEINSSFIFKKYYKIDNLIVKNIFKHLYSGSFFFPTKYEFVFSISGHKRQIDYEHIRKLLDQILLIKLNVKTAQGWKEIMLKNLVKELPSFHVYSTSYSNQLQGNNILSLVNSCTPQIFMQFDEGEYINITGRTLKLFSNSQDYELYNFPYTSINTPYVVWILNRINRMYSNSRTVRISMLRLHSEYECFRKLVHNFNQGRLDVKDESSESDILQDYLNRATQTFLRETRIAKEHDVCDFFDEYSRIFSEFQPGELLSLKSKILQLKIRRQVRNKAINFIQNIENMENNFNVNNSPGAAVGFGNTANNQGAIQLVSSFPSDYNFSALVEQLDRLKTELKMKADTTEELEAVSNVSKAKDAAEKKDGARVLEYLKLGGHWIFETASRIGAHLIADILMHPPV